jgi:hypothetical protein
MRMVNHLYFKSNLELVHQYDMIFKIISSTKIIKLILKEVLFKAFKESTMILLEELS